LYSGARYDAKLDYLRQWLEQYYLTGLAARGLHCDQNAVVIVHKSREKIPTTKTLKYIAIFYLQITLKKYLSKFAMFRFVINYMQL